MPTPLSQTTGPSISAINGIDNHRSGSCRQVSKTRLLFVVDDLTVASGRNCQLRQLAESLPVSEYEIHIATSFDSQPPHPRQINGVSLHCLDHHSTVVSKYLELRKLVQHLQPDIVHAWGYSSHFPVAFARYQNSNAKAIYSYFCMPPRRLMIQRWLEELATQEPAIATVPLMRSSTAP